MAASSVALRFAGAVVVGVLATKSMELVMARRPEGWTPPSIASGVLTGRPPGDAPDRLASVVHHVAGTLTGPLFVWFTFAGEAVLGPGLPTVAVAAVVLYGLMVAFFAVVVLPRSLVAAERVPAIRRDWALSAAAYLVVLVPIVAALSLTL